MKKVKYCTYLMQLFFFISYSIQAMENQTLVPKDSPEVILQNGAWLLKQGLGDNNFVEVHHVVSNMVYNAKPFTGDSVAMCYVVVEYGLHLIRKHLKQI